MTALENDLKRSQEHERYLEEQLRKRPFEVKIKADIVDTNNHPGITNLIIEKLKDKERFTCQVRIKKERLWVIPIGYIDSCNANFDCEEQGQIFAGVLDNEPLNEKLKFNDLVQFQSCDVFDIRTIS